MGYGKALCDALETSAKAAGVTTLYLLTTSAAKFFAAQGYVKIDRSDAPVAVRRTPEFTNLCPETAVCMYKLL